MSEFVLQALHPTLHYPFLETRIAVASVFDLSALIGAGDDDPNLERGYNLTDDQFDAVIALAGLPAATDRRLTTLCPWRSLRRVPYLIHTGFELPLMLEGRKPLSAFVDEKDWLSEELAHFDAFVANKSVIRHYFERGNLLEVYFTLPGHEWRAEAYRNLCADKAGDMWSDDRERRQGELLGYEDWQNDWWMAHRRDVLSAD